MKTRKTFMALATMALLTGFASCDTEDVEAPSPKYEISIAKKPDFAVTSGGRTLGATFDQSRAATGDPDMFFFKEADVPDLYKDNIPSKNLNKHTECEYVYACIKEDAALVQAGLKPIYEVDKASFTDKTFFIINAYSAKDHDAAGNHSSVAGDMHDLCINGQNVHEYTGQFKTNVQTAIALIETKDGLKDVTYDDSFGVKKETYTVSEWKLFYVPEYGYYIGMDYGSHKYGLDPDGEYTDWVIKVVPAKANEEEIDETNGSVEVNLSVNDEHSNGDYIATKLSVHVRALTDAEVFIPVDKAYYCVADDMDISLSHKELNVIYNTEPQYIETNVGGKVVTFTVQYEDNGIRITTDGIDKSVIEYCAKEYADGITFEVWNYFKDITRADLKPMLDKATVTFLDANPASYVNAFAKIPGYSETPVYSAPNEDGQLVPYIDEACTKPLDQKYWTRETPDSKDYIFVGQINPWDCTVAPVEPAYKKVEKDNTDPSLPDYNVLYNL